MDLKDFYHVRRHGTPEVEDGIHQQSDPLSPPSPQPPSGQSPAGRTDSPIQRPKAPKRWNFDFQPVLASQVACSETGPTVDLEPSHPTVSLAGPSTIPIDQPPSPSLIYPSQPIDIPGIIHPIPRTASILVCPFGDRRIIPRRSSCTDAYSEHQQSSSYPITTAGPMLRPTRSLSEAKETLSQTSPFHGPDPPFPPSPLTIGDNLCALPRGLDPQLDFMGATPHSLWSGSSASSSVLCNRYGVEGTYPRPTLQAFLQPHAGLARAMETSREVLEVGVPTQQVFSQPGASDESLAPTPDIAYQHLFSGVLSHDDKPIILASPPGLSLDQSICPCYPPVDLSINPSKLMPSYYPKKSPIFSAISSNPSGSPLYCGSAMIPVAASEDVQSSTSAHNSEHSRPRKAPANTKKRNRESTYSLDSSGALGSTLDDRPGRIKRKIEQSFFGPITTTWNQIIRRVPFAISFRIYP